LNCADSAYSAYTCFCENPRVRESKIFNQFIPAETSSGIRANIKQEPAGKIKISIAAQKKIFLNQKKL
jgi:hypothetical protein